MSRQSSKAYGCLSLQRRQLGLIDAHRHDPRQAVFCLMGYRETYRSSSRVLFIRIMVAGASVGTSYLVNHAITRAE